MSLLIVITPLGLTTFSVMSPCLPVFRMLIVLLLVLIFLIIILLSLSLIPPLYPLVLHLLCLGFPK